MAKYSRGNTKDNKKIFMNKNKYSFYIVLALEILIVVLTGIGILPKDAILIITGLLIFYFLFSEVEDSLILFIISIPLFAALPIGNFDSMANWRILLAILFLCLFFKQGLSIKVVKNKLGNFFKGIKAAFREGEPRPDKSGREKSRHYPMEFLTVIFLGVGALSLLAATDLIVGVKKILFLVNIFLLYIIIRNVIANNKEMIPKIIKAGAFAGIISLIVGYSQLIFVLLKPLYTFWHWWTRNVISVFYGDNLSGLLTVSNTWFSYYENSAPTLRMFSVFPDSHSFTLFTIISLIFISFLLVFKAYKSRVINYGLWLLIVLSFLVLVFSGSRGVWVSAVVPFLCLIFLTFFKRKIKLPMPVIDRPVIKILNAMLIIFVLSFPVSSWILSQSYQADGDDASLAFKRAKSITDLEELSVKSRIGIWRASFQSILKNPILGVGIGNYPVVLDEDISAAKKGASAHNLYLDVASEMGLIGLIILLLVFWQIFKKSLKRPIFAFFLTWILIYNLFDVVLLNDKVLLLFMVALGLLYSVNNYDK